AAPDPAAASRDLSVFDRDSVRVLRAENRPDARLMAQSVPKRRQRTVNGRSTDARRTVGSPTCIQPPTSQRTVSGRSVSRVGAMKTKSSSMTPSASPRALGFPFAAAVLVVTPDDTDRTVERLQRWVTG